MNSTSLRIARAALLPALFSIALFAAFFVSAPFAHAVATNVTTQAATGITTTDATLNATNGDTAADNTSFWWGPSSSGPFAPAVDPSSQLPGGWSHHPTGTGPQSIGASFIYTLTGLTPGTTYYFVAWSQTGGMWYPGDVLSFVATPTHTLTYAAGAHGSVTGTSPQTVADGGNGTAVTAVADAGYYFVDWSDSSTDNPRTDISVIGSISVTANFAQYTDVYVDSAGSDSNDGFSLGSPVLTINHAISIVPTGGTVHVAAGTYNENVTLNKDVILSGAQAGIDARGRSASESIIAPTAVGITLVAGSAGATIDGFTISGGTRGIESSSGPLNGLTIQNNRIVSFTSAGIFLNDTGTDITIDQNDINASSQTGSGGVIHLDTDGFDGMWITNNNVTHSTSGTGLFSDGNHNVGISGARSPKLSGNLFQSNNTGVNLGTRSWEYADIAGNTFQNSTFDGLQGGIQHSTISGNTFDNNGRSGLALTSFGNTGADRGAQHTTVSGNTFTGNDTEAIKFSATQAVGTIATNVFIHNNVASDNVSGATYTGSETIDGRENWWGSANGPTVASNLNSARGVAIGSTITYRPWCLESTCSSVDTAVPTVSGVTVTPNTTTGGAVSITVGFSESMNTGIAPTITVTGLSGGTLTATGSYTSATEWQGSVTIPDNDEEVPAAAVSVAGAEDPSGNQLVTDTSHTFSVDTLTPVIGSISSDAMASGWLKIGDSITFTVTTNKAEPGAAVNAPTYNGEALTWTTSDDIHFTATYIVIAGNTDQTAPLQLTGVTVTDAAGNTSDSVSGSDIAKTIDAHVPVITTTVSESVISPDASAGVKDTAVIDTAFSEASAYSIDIKNVGLTTVRHWGGTSINPNARTWDGADNAGDQVAEGIYTVVITATDVAGNITVDSSYTVVVDNTRPVIVLTGLNPQTIEAHGTYSELGSTVTDNIDVGLIATVDTSPLDIDTVGTYAVHYDATDSAGNPAIQVDRTVNVVDTTPPVVTVPSDITAEATSPSGAVVTFSSSALDSVDGPLATVCVPTSGSTFALGTTNVTCSATDTHGNSDSASFDVIVVDTTGPSITVPDDITAEATSPAGAVVSYTAPSATDAVDVTDAVSCDMNSGDTFPLGTTPVTCTSSDAVPNLSTATFNVTVVDTTPPSIDTNPDITGVEATSAAGATVSFSNPTATDIADAAVDVACLPASGSTFALGTTLVTCTATDDASLTNTSTFNVTVVDTTVPNITLIGTNPMSVVLGNTFTDPGATTTDNYDADTFITSADALDTTVAGSHTLNYNYTDTNGNSTTTTRTVTVSASELSVTPGEPSEGYSTGTLTNAASSTVSNMTVEIPADTDVTGGSGWDGTINLPTVSTSYTSPTADSGTTVTVTLALEVGSSTSALTFNKGVRILFAGQAGARVGWTRDGGPFTEITSTCANDSQATGDALPAAGDCKIVVGSDLVVWTKHFTTFLTYTQTTNPTSGGGGGGGGGGGVVGLYGSTNTNPQAPSTGTGTGTGVGTGTGFGGEVLGAATFNFVRNLGIGSTGADVTALQQILIGAGFLNISAPTGYYGSLTFAAVKKYQAAHGISQVGVVGPVTRATLNRGSTAGTSSVTEPQIQAILGLLRSFGADESVIANTEKALRNR